jgi:hypothetical protein
VARDRAIQARRRLIRLQLQALPPPGPEAEGVAARLNAWMVDRDLKEGLLDSLSRFLEPKTSNEDARSPDGRARRPRDDEG